MGGRRTKFEAALVVVVRLLSFWGSFGITYAIFRYGFHWGTDSAQWAYIAATIEQLRASIAEHR